MTIISKFLSKTVKKIKVRTILCFAFFIANFLVAHGAAMYWNFGKSPFEMFFGLVLSVMLIVILSEPS